MVATALVLGDVGPRSGLAGAPWNDDVAFPRDVFPRVERGEEGCAVDWRHVKIRWIQSHIIVRTARHDDVEREEQKSCRLDGILWNA